MTDVDQEIIDRNMKCLTEHEEFWEIITESRCARSFICRKCSPKEEQSDLSGVCEREPREDSGSTVSDS